MLSHETPRAGLRDALRADHQLLDAQFSDFLAKMRAGDTAAVDRAWTAFETAIGAHLDAEEVVVFPRFEVVDAHEWRALRAEHARIRSLVAEIGVGLQLHAVSEQTVRELVQFLRAHATREEGKLYTWVDRGISAEASRGILGRLRAVFR